MEGDETPHEPATNIFQVLDKCFWHFWSATACDDYFSHQYSRGLLFGWLQSGRVGSIRNVGYHVGFQRVGGWRVRVCTKPGWTKFPFLQTSSSAQTFKWATVPNFYEGIRRWRIFCAEWNTTCPPRCSGILNLRGRCLPTSLATCGSSTFFLSSSLFCSYLKSISRKSVTSLTRYSAFVSFSSLNVMLGSDRFLTMMNRSWS